MNMHIERSHCHPLPYLSTDVCRQQHLRVVTSQLSAQDLLLPRQATYHQECASLHLDCKMRGTWIANFHHKSTRLQVGCMMREMPLAMDELHAASRRPLGARQ